MLMGCVCFLFLLVVDHYQLLGLADVQLKVVWVLGPPVLLLKFEGKISVSFVEGSVIMDDCVVSWRGADYVLVISQQDVKISPTMRETSDP